MNRRQAGTVLLASTAVASEPRPARARKGTWRTMLPARQEGGMPLVCASEGLATVFRGAPDQARQSLHLPEGQFVTFARTVGHAADGAPAAKA